MNSDNAKTSYLHRLVILCIGENKLTKKYMAL